jgi:hypothetical protein
MNDYEKQVYRRFAGLPDSEDVEFYRDRAQDIVEHDITCECGRREFCPVHDEA